MLRPTVKQLVVVSGELDLWFPLRVLGITTIDDIVGLYKSSDGLPKDFRDPSYPYLSDPRNLWPKVRSSLFVGQQEGIISGFCPTILPDRTCVRLIVRHGQINAELLVKCHALTLEKAQAEGLLNLKGLSFASDSTRKNVYPSDPARVVWEVINNSRTGNIWLKLEDDITSEALYSGQQVIAYYSDGTDSMTDPLITRRMIVSSHHDCIEANQEGENA